jgi:hypothetical protein
VERLSGTTLEGVTKIGFHSLAVADRGTAGLMGTRLSRGPVQQAPVEQLLRSALQHLQAGTAEDECERATATPPCQTVRKQSNTATNGDKVLRSTWPMRIL